MTATTLLNRAAELLEERGKQYDKPTGERSMAKTVAAFNAITGRDLTEREGWLMMLVLKQVRLFQTETHHHDSAEDAISYAALLAECSAAVDEKMPAHEFDPRGMSPSEFAMYCSGAIRK